MATPVRIGRECAATRGKHGLVAEVAERDAAAIDPLALRFGAVVERRPPERLRAEIKAVREAQDAAERGTAKARRDQRKARREAMTEARGKALKQQFEGPAASRSHAIAQGQLPGQSCSDRQVGSSWRSVVPSNGPWSPMLR